MPDASKAHRVNAGSDLSGRDDPRTEATLGRPRGRYPTFADHLARLKAAEPHATAERLIELEREAAQATRQPAAYTDVTVSFSKSISILHASIRENERRARPAGDEQAAAYWTVQEQRFQEILQRANRAALQYAQDWAGVTRTGSHGTRVDGRETGRFESAGLIVTSWLQGTGARAAGRPTFKGSALAGGGLVVAH
jgi:predicted component of type VI protein secretion system